MPFEMDYDDESGANHPNSYWVIRSIFMNDPNSNGSVTFHGYLSATEYYSGQNPIGVRIYNVVDPAVYEAYFSQASYVTVWEIPFFSVLESMAHTLDDFFLHATSFSYLKPSSIEIGSLGSSRLIVNFPAPIGIQIMGNLITGVTIKVDGVEASIDNAARNSNNTAIYYTLVDAVDPDAVVTWELDSVNFLRDAAHFSIHAFAPQTASNTIGSLMQFNDAGNSLLVALL